MCACQKGSHSVPPAQAFQAKTMETGDKNRNVSQCHTLFCEESLGQIGAKDVKLFWNRSVREFYCLKVLITLEEVNTLIGESFDGEAINWSGVVNSHCVQMGLVISIQFIFSND